MHFPGVPAPHFPSSQTQVQIFFLPNVRSIARELGNDYHGWAIFSDGGTRVVDGDIFAGWGVISRSLRGRIFVLFGRVITNEALRSHFGSRDTSVQVNNVAVSDHVFHRFPVLIS